MLLSNCELEINLNEFNNWFKNSISEKLYIKNFCSNVTFFSLGILKKNKTGILKIHSELNLNENKKSLNP